MSFSLTLVSNAIKVVNVQDYNGVDQAGPVDHYHSSQSQKEMSLGQGLLNVRSL